MKKLFIILTTILLLFSCDSDDSGDQFETDLLLIEQYIEDNNLEVEKTDSGLSYIIHEEGTGENLNEESFVEASFKLSGLDGTVYLEGTTKLDLKFMVEGLKESFLLIKKGGSVTAICPSGLAYGPRKHIYIQTLIYLLILF